MVPSQCLHAPNDFVDLCCVPFYFLSSHLKKNVIRYFRWKLSCISDYLVPLSELSYFKFSDRKDLNCILYSKYW